MSEFIQVTERNQVVTLTLNRPDKRNALHGPMVVALQQQLLQFSSHPEVRVVVIKGNGKDFCAGADIHWMQQMAECQHTENVADAERLSELMYILYNYPKPTVAVAQGTILGGGLGLLAACDMVLVSRLSSMGFSEVKIGLIPATISPYIVAAIGERMARYYFLTGERFDANEAKRLGLVHQVIEPEYLDEAADRFVNELMMNGPQALTAIKKLIHHVSDEEISPSLGKKLAVHLANTRISNEVKEGVSAFLEKRKPVWK